MKQKILLTGITGLIGRNTAKLLLDKDHEIHTLIRPGTNRTRFEQFADKVKFNEIDLADIGKLKTYLAENKFDSIVHIGAVRGGRKFPRKTYFAVNVDATEQLIINALANNSKFIFCSSVGVFGAIPEKLPADENTPRKNDNYYHYTKIRAEALIQNYVLKGLNSVILRPAITYGPGDFGFPFTLTKLVDKRLFPITTKPVSIHLTNIELISQAFIKALEKDIKPGTAFNVADSEPVIISELADYVSMQLKNKPYAPFFKLSNIFFDWGEYISKLFKNELWTARFELISKNWYYNTKNTYTILELKKFKTIPDFKILTDWYKEI